MSDLSYTKFEAKVVVEGPYTSAVQVFTPASLLGLALQHALFSMPAEAVADLVRKPNIDQLTRSRIA
ncbi:hypothetical protein PSTH1771_10795 [Pseudomonas syringae pv. theae]|uniref:Uncharacterized protein n=6 Tax=Pseudomonas syringae group TaxID=136849 RepID=A0A9X0H5B3_PSESX|nr:MULTISPECIES: hypothetical protein [Pseudomonas syringae group]KPW90029.1 hypothetical protein ALO79_200052 [Pseudomonas syringae pv. castaneae]KPX14426.1 Uncharacterized protein ALO73_02870 [Pseudomonas syringae pv. daphniphylli]KWS88759.1 hypothetical protein AL050_21710 [Pseudomonas syringae pv. daphniphylli]KWS89805.1 hypothetical protein AL048_09170 [Pseudomonas syringae pv. castaneae]MBL3832791.1 hypothetical protein [Pseudomonas syringae pv. theae]